MATAKISLVDLSSKQFRMSSTIIEDEFGVKHRSNIFSVNRIV